MAITGKLCRNPFSTIKLSQEDGGSKAALSPGDGFSRCGHTIFAVDNFGFVDARSGAVYSESLGKRVIRVGRRENGRSAMNN
ncbi:hypothetical protein ACWGS9_31900 [Bradyrhizobium sp. Arg314]